MDEHLIALHGASPHGPAVTVVATGGYGRRELCPWSDVDLLLLHAGLETPALEVVVRDLVHPLWDAGLHVGYAVRDRREVVASLADLDSATALIDARAVAGSRHLLQAVLAAAHRRIRRRGRELLRALALADDDRHQRAGSAAEGLEPDLKSGAGGLRDVQSLRWAAATIAGTSSTGLDGLVSAAYLGADDLPRLARAYDHLLDERVALHRERAGPGDVLWLAVHDAVARRLGHTDGRSELDTAPHRLLTAHYHHARAIDHVHRRAWALLDRDARRGRRRLRAAERRVDGFAVEDGTLRVDPSTDLHDPELPMRVLAALARSGTVLGRRSAARLRVHARTRPAPERWTDGDRERFLDVLWTGGGAVTALTELDDVGLLSAVLPEWEPLRCRAQRNPFHRYSLDRHCLHTAAALADLVAGQVWAKRAFALVADRDALLIGALLHDVGKAHGEPHGRTGVAVATRAARRMGLDEREVEVVATLVREHLLLVDTATRRDLRDPAVVREVADRLADRGTLHALHLLSAADGLATSEKGWTVWTATLVRTLVEEVDAMFVADADADLEARAARVTEAALSLASELDVDAAVVRSHLAAMPDRYAASVSPRGVVRHAVLASAPLAPGEVRTRLTAADVDDDDVTAGPSRIDELVVVAADQPRLFARVAGAVTLHGGSVLAAAAYTRDDHVAVDTFTIVPPDHATGSWWVTVEADLTEAVAGRLALRARVQRKVELARERAATVAVVRPVVTVEPDPGGTLSIVEVRARDHAGVLYLIASALAELDLDIVVAKVTTRGFEAVDVFYVHDAHGEPLDTHLAEEVELAIRAALQE